MRRWHLDVFQAGYSCGSDTAAAEYLNVSQPSVSKVLAHAEQQLGYALVDRIKGKLVPTPEADRLHRHVYRVNESVDRLRNVAKNLRIADTGRVRIAATPAFGVDFLPSAIARFHRLHPEVQFMVETRHLAELSAGLLESRYDLGLAFDAESMPGIRSEVLGHGSFVALTPPDMDLGPVSALGIAELAAFPFIRLDDEGPLGRLLSNHIESSGVQMNTLARVQTYQVAKALVSHGSGVTVIDEITARSEGHENVRIWPLKPALQFRICAMTQEQAPLSLPSQKFMEHLAACLDEFLASG